MVFFVSGHGDVTLDEFKAIYVPILDKITTAILCGEKHSFVIGDFKGVDTFAQHYIKRVFDDFLMYNNAFSMDDMFLTAQANKNKEIFFENYPVTIYHLFEYPRIKASEMYKSVGGFTSDEERDAAMTKNSDFDIAFVKESKLKSGTYKNIYRRIKF